MPTLLDRIRTNATDTVTEVADTAGSTAGEVADAIGSGLEHAASTLSDAAGSAGSAIADSATDAAGTLLERIADLADALRERLGDAVDDAGKAGRATARSAGGRVEDLPLGVAPDLGRPGGDAARRDGPGDRRGTPRRRGPAPRAPLAGHGRGALRPRVRARLCPRTQRPSSRSDWRSVPRRRPPVRGSSTRIAGPADERASRPRAGGSPSGRRSSSRRGIRLRGAADSGTPKSSRRTPVRGHRGDRVESASTAAAAGRAAQRRCARGCLRRRPPPQLADARGWRARSPSKARTRSAATGIATWRPEPDRDRHEGTAVTSGT